MYRFQWSWAHVCIYVLTLIPQFGNLPVVSVLQSSSTVIGITIELKLSLHVMKTLQVCIQHT